MAIPKLALPDDCRYDAFLAVVRWLKADPALGRVVKTWAVWDGSDYDAQEPTLDLCPWVRLTPVALPSSQFSGGGLGCGSALSPLQVKVETAVAGHSVRDSLNLWGALESRIFPQDQTTRDERNTLFLASGISDAFVTFSQAAAGIPNPLADSLSTMIVSPIGSLELRMYVYT